ncbi:hypothetical protein [Maridesulfovibrio hydrothermalis]|uniref:Uncharacterized protein n=1 Tax=Maridesulfovibrio hydrothermalis AM13 = DSM 14728 TaxID=1121451 RepID=L0RBM7_9BACT|nr:hypothetical protein [Maridesulfovibrio hydrothermalis]CCO23627.1 conserved protein of unknown function [Maridesulfovibrio hydrothermalis AM13 = DSM 14728]
MIPLNYAILKHITTVKEASVNCVMDALKTQYGHFKAFKKHSIMNALMTAEANGLIEETRFDMDSNQELRVFYRAHKEGAETINKYIKN